MMNGEEGSFVDMITHLPNDLLFNCLARISRLHYPNISLSCKRFRSLVTSTELYQTRTLLGNTEDCLYVCIRFNCRPRWYSLCHRPTRNPNPNSRCFRPNRIFEKRSCDIIFEPDWPTVTAIGSNIYAIGQHNRVLSSRVLFMDCRSHTWNKAPSMQIKRDWPLVSFHDGKIYVVEGSNNPESSDLMEVFDPDTGIWSRVPSPRMEILGPQSRLSFGRRQQYPLKSLSMDGKLYLIGDTKSMSYNPEENKWDVADVELCKMIWGSYCVIDNILYCYATSRVLQWYDFEGRLWRQVKVLGKLPQCWSHVMLVNYGGNIALLWDKRVRGIDSDEKTILCAVIAVEKRNGQEIYGKVEWCDVVLTTAVRESGIVLGFLAVTV